MKTILVVDDDPLQLEFAALHLGRHDQKVVTERTAAGALRRLRLDRFDVVITDFEMPDMNGLALLKKMRELAVKCPAILVTGSEDLSAVNEAYRLGVFTFASKPVKWNILNLQIAAAIEKHKIS